MKIALNELNNKKSIDINYDVLYDNEIDPRIKDLKGAKVKGEVCENSNGDITLNCLFTGTMYIEDSYTLELVPLDFSITISENLEEIIDNYPNVYEKMQNTLDLKQILWQNIVLEVPMSYTKNKNVSLKGEGWELLNNVEKSAGIDPRLQKLEDLLKGDD